MPKNAKSLIALLLGVVILAAAYFGAYTQYMNWEFAKDAFAIAETENIRIKQAQSDANAFLSKYESNRDKVDIANKILPLGDTDTAIILANFEKIADESGLIIRALNITEGRVESEANSTNIIHTSDIDFSLVGSYEAFNNFILRMQRNLRIADLIKFQVSSGDEDTADGTTLEFDLTFRTYFQE